MFVAFMKPIRPGAVPPPASLSHVLVLFASLIFAGSLRASPDPVFIDWPASITNVWQSTQVTYTNATYPYGLAVSNINGAALVSIVSGANGFAVNTNAGQQNVGGTDYILLYFTPGTNSAITQPYTNTIQVALTNVTGAPPFGSATTNIDIVITPPPANYPVFTTNFVTTWPTASGSNVATIGPHFVATNPSGSPILYPVPDITNVTAVYALFLSNSVGETSCAYTNTMPGTNRNYLATSNGFALVPGSWSGTNPIYANVGALSLHPSNPWQGATNPTIAAAIYASNNQAWIGLPIVPGTSTNSVTNYVQLLAYNANNTSTANWTTNNIEIVVAPPLPAPSALEVRFYNSSTNAATDVYILPTSTDALGAYGNGFWWSNSLSGSNNWTNWIATSNYATVRLSDIGVSGTNAQGRPYYSIFTTNFPDAAWFLSYGGGHLTNGSPAPSPKTGGAWYGSEWAPFEVTLDGNPADKCDMTYINQFAIPMTVRSLTNDYASSVAGIYPTNSLAYYQICGITNWTSSSTVAVMLSNLATQLSVNFPNAAITNGNGKTVMYSGPSAAGMGALIAPATPPFTNGQPNSFATFEPYFAAVRENTARTNKIKDSIGLSAATNAGLGTNPIFMFAYDFDVVVTTNNSLLLTNGKITVSNQPGSTGTNLAKTNYTGLWMQIGGDAGTIDNWASSAVYLAPTPANYVTNSGSNAAIQLYSDSASNSLGGTPVFTSSTNAWMELATNTGTVCGKDRTVIIDPTTIQLYQSQFGTAVMGRMTGDLAAGFALGFINSTNINPNYGTNVAFGDSPSGSWWGGNEYPAGGSNPYSYSDVNTNFSVWGNTIYSATRVTYGHPIYDRMQYYGGGNPTSPLQIQPASATNNQVSGAGGAMLLPVWVVEVEFFNGLSSVGDSPVPSVLTYSNWLTNYPSLGTNTNTEADPDGDGSDNGQEYAFGGNPTVGTPALLSATSSPSNAVIGFIALSNAASNYTVLSTTNLATGNSWSNYAATVTNAAPPFTIPLPDYYLGRAFTVPITPGTNRFFKVVFTNQ